MENRKAFHNYFITDRYTAGMILVGSEVKALRDNKVGFNGSYVYLKNGQLCIKNLYIGEFKLAAVPHEPLRERILLLTKPELKKVEDWLKIKGNTIVPLSIFISNNVFKIELGFAKGKKQHDQREDIKKRDLEREQQIKIK